jgi:hypothetical protein
MTALTQAHKDGIKPWLLNTKAFKDRKTENELATLVHFAFPLPSAVPLIIMSPGSLPLYKVP